MKYVRMFFAFAPLLLSIVLGLLVDAIFTWQSIVFYLVFGLLCASVYASVKTSYQLLVDVSIIALAYALYQSSDDYVLGKYKWIFYVLFAGYYLLINHAKRKTRKKKNKANLNQLLL